MVSDIRFYRVSQALGAIVALGALVLACAPFTEARDDAPPVDPRRSDDATLPADGGTAPTDAATDSAGDPATAEASASASASASIATGVVCNGAVDCERVVFVTSEKVRGWLIHGVAGADAMCNKLAAASSNSRVAGRTFVAWISDDTRSPSTSMIRGTQAYVRPDGVRIASDYLHLTSGGALENPIERDERGEKQDGAVWSATSPSGDWYGASCYDWSNQSAVGSRGTITASAQRWTRVNGGEGDPVDCNETESRIYCFER